jgi:hypothetical protein
LSLADELLELPNLPAGIGLFLRSQRGQFLFSNTAPDVQVISGQARETTHFFSLPIHADDRPAWEALLLRCPQFASVERMPPGHAAFMVGYLCHLQADWMWIKQIFAPVFGPRQSWGGFENRLYYHNVLRAYLDRNVVSRLKDVCLRAVNPEGWLPFVQDCHLVEWRDFLSQQLQPGAATLTVEVFSSRQGVSAPEYYALLESEDRMQEEVFKHIPLQQVLSYRSRVLDENIGLLSRYLAFALHQDELMTECYLPQGAHP